MTLGRSEDQINCLENQYYDSNSKTCQECAVQCGKCTMSPDNCLSCKDDTMSLTGNQCLCPSGTSLHPITGQCTLNQTRTLDPRVSNFRNLQAITQIVSTSQIISSNQTFDSIEFRSWDNTFQNTYMLQVASFVPYLQVTFRNCIIDVKGLFFTSMYPVKLLFDNCLFKVGNTTGLVVLDYSTGAQYGCTQGNDVNAGDFIITNSNFTDTTLSTVSLNPSTPKYLFKLTSLYDFTLHNATFSSLMQTHQTLLSDHPCQVPPLKPQRITLNVVKIADSNMNAFLNFTGFSSAVSELRITLASMTFTNYKSSVPWLQASILRSNTQLMNITGLQASQMTLEVGSPLIQVVGTGSRGTSISAQQINLTNNKLTDFLAVETAESVSVQGLTADSINNQVNLIATADPMKNGMFQFNNVKTVLLDSFAITQSSFSLCPIILMDSVSSFTLQNSILSSISVVASDLIIAKKASYFYSTNVQIISIIDSKMHFTKYVYQITPLQLTLGISQVKIDKPTLKNSQIPLLSVKGVTKTVSTDNSKYQISLQFCTLQNNIFVGFDILGFTDLPTSQMDLVNTFCIDTGLMPTCSQGQYYDTILKQCTACPNGCSSCSSKTQCTNCTVAMMSVNPITGSCQCPAQMYYYDIDGKPRCRACLSKCQTCNNEYQCLTYKTCPSNQQQLNMVSQQCQFVCPTGYQDKNSNTCKSCSDSNCAICDKLSSGEERCGLCQNGYFLDLKTYTCMPSCPILSKKIETVNTYTKGKGFPVKFCRPFVSQTPFQYVYYIDPNSTSHLELGTFEYPFKNMDTPAKEIFNFMYEMDTNFTVYHKRGTSMKHYYGIMPITVVNVKLYTLLNYGDPSLPNPRIYITGHDYLWPDSTLFSTAEIFYDYTTRVQRGDMDISESTKFFLKFSIFRSSMFMKGLDFQSIMFGDAWSNPLIFSFDAPNRTVIVEDCYFDLDGAFYEAYFPISLYVRRSHFNVTNYQYGVWNDFRWDCYANNATDLGGKLVIEDNLFTDHHQQALYNFFFFSSFDDFVLRNNTFNGVTYLDMETRPFIDVHPQSMCDPDWRTQRITIDYNKFLNLDGSSLMFAINYMNNFNGTKIFSMQNNHFQDSIINSQLVSMQIQNPSQVNVGNNYYNNVTILKDKKIFYFFSDKSNITIKNETLISNILDDLYTIGSANNVFVEDFTVTNNDNTGAITETSAILRISTASNVCKISRFRVKHSTFRYGKAIEIEQALILQFSNAEYSGNTLQNQDFFVFNQIVQSQISNLTFTSFEKMSDKSRFALTMPTLSLIPKVSSHFLSNITFTNSGCSFISVSQVQTSFLSTNIDPSFVQKSDDGTYRFDVSNCTISQNTLSSKDPLLDFGEINYQNFSVSLAKVNIIDNNLELGTIYQMKLNCKEFIISESQILRNTGQFALLEPASSDDTNPLNFFIFSSNFISNFARADAMIQLTSNSALRARNSRFLENFSVGRGSVVFADYQSVYALFENCDFIRNYAYQGGAFYVQYSSMIEVSNSYITQNFAVTGGVAYVNNDGQIKINKGSRVFQNSALNSCFLFLINSQYESQIDNITITSNDQKNALIPKDKFQDIYSAYLHFKVDFFNSMALISDKVQRTINERADTAIYAIKAKINITNTVIYKNDVILSASTESVVSVVNSTIRDIEATSRLVTAVSSTIEFYRVRLLNVFVNYIQSDSPNWEGYINSLNASSYILTDSKGAQTTLATSSWGDIVLVTNQGTNTNMNIQQLSGDSSQSGSILNPQKMDQAKLMETVQTQLTQSDVQMAALIPQSQTQFFKVSIVNKSFMRALNCTFDSIQGTFLYVSGSSVVIEGNSTLRHFFSAEQESELFVFDSSSVQISDAQFFNLTQTIVSPIIRFQESYLQLARASFRLFNKVLFFLEGGRYIFDTLAVSDGQMTWPSDPYMVNSIVLDVSSADLSISNAIFSGIFTNYSSPIIYIENDPQASDKHSLSLAMSKFVNNVANESAGVLQAVNTNVTIDHCHFENNTALLQDAGALYLDCHDTISTSCMYNITNSIFKNNYAGVNGGAIKYTFYPPLISQNNTFINNTAMYGSPIASYPVQMRIANVFYSRQLGFLNTTQIQKLNLSSNSIVFELLNSLQSGALMNQNLTMEILDEKMRKIITDNQSIAIMSSQSPNVTVMKSKSVKAQSGIFEFNDVIVVGPPGTEILLKVNTDSISNDKIQKAYPGLLQTLPEIYVKGKLRLCVRGEFQTTDYKCIQCSDGFFTLKDNQQQCQECPENAVCSNGFNISLDQGYWRNDTESIQIYECYNKDACLGSNMSLCAPGYRGNLCHSCGKHKNIWYSRESNNECVECLDYQTNSGRLAGVTIVIIAYFILLIYVNISAVEQGQNQRIATVCMRILTNYFQILTLASSYDLSWSDNMKTFLQWISIIAQSSQILFSVDCFIRDNGIDTEPQYFKMVLAIIFPAICIILITAFWVIVGYFRKNTQTATRLIMSITILIFMTLPAVTTITFAIYNCVDVFSDGNTYLALDVSLECWTGNHNFYASNIGIPIILLWIVGLPIIALIIMYCQRKSLADENNIARYGFLYTGLNHNAFYWEILLHFRKVIMICINVFLTTFKPLYRALIGFMLMIIYIEILQKVQPYSTQEVNDLEFKANIAAFATFYGGLFFISSDLHFSVTTILFLLILLVNAVFWWAWIRMMVLGWIRQKLGFYLRKIKCCRNSFLIKVIQGESDDINQINADKIKEIEAEEVGGPGADNSQLGPGSGAGRGIPPSAYKGNEDFEMDEGYEEHKFHPKNPAKKAGYEDDFDNDIIVKGQTSHQNTKKSSKSSRSKAVSDEHQSAVSDKQKKKGKNIYKTVDQTQFVDMSVRQGLNNQLELDESRGEYGEYAHKKIKGKTTKQIEEDDDYIVEKDRKKSKDRAKAKQKMIDIIASDDEDEQRPQINANGKKSLIDQKNARQQKTMDVRGHSGKFDDTPNDQLDLDNSVYEDSDQEQQIIEDSSESQQQQKPKKKKKKFVKKVVKKIKESVSQPLNNDQKNAMLRKNTTINNNDNGESGETPVDSQSYVSDSIEQFKGSSSNTQNPTSQNSGDIKSKEKQSVSDNAQTQKTASTGNILHQQSTPNSNTSSTQPQNIKQNKKPQLDDSSDESTPKLPLKQQDHVDQGFKSRSSHSRQARKDDQEERSQSRKKESSSIRDQIRKVTSKTRKQSNSSQESPRVHPKQASDIERSENRHHGDNKKGAVRQIQEDSEPVHVQASQKNEKYSKQMEKKGRNKPDEAVKAQKGRPVAEIDMSQQDADKEEVKNPMNRTAQEQEKLFSKQRPNMDKTIQNFAQKKDIYKKMKSRKVSSHESDSQEEKKGEDSSEAEETNRQMLQQKVEKRKESRSKSRGHKVSGAQYQKREQIEDDSGSGQGQYKAQSSGGNDSNQQLSGQQARKVSKLRPKNQRNEVSQQATPSMFMRPKQDAADDESDQDYEGEVAAQQQQRRKNRHQSPQLVEQEGRPHKERKSQTREGGSRRDKSRKKKRDDIRDSLSP